MSWRPAVPAVALGVLLAGCGFRHGEQGWALVTAQTCASTLARAGLPAPSGAQIDPQRFLSERRRLLDGGAWFNTVSPYKNVCSAIRDELRSAPTLSTVAGQSPVP